MHYGLGVIVYGHTEKEALAQAEKVMGWLSCKDCGRPFDYYTITGLDGEPPVMKASSKKGQEMIATFMDVTKKDFMRQLRNLRKSLAVMTDEEVYAQRHPGEISDDVRFAAYHVGMWKGPGIFLYDNDGEGIREPGHLKDTIEKWPTLTDRSTRSRLDSAGDVWVVTADAHS
jgi:hypothetical protein